MNIREHLDSIFNGDRAVRESEEKLLKTGKQAELESVLEAAVHEAAALGDRKEASMRLERLADLCAQVPGPRMADSLITILNDMDPGVRVAAGEALLDVSYERYAEVARAIERVLTNGLRGPAMAELPWLLAEVGEPSALKLIRRFLVHPDAEVIAAGIEALVHLRDPEAISALEPLLEDSRTVTLEDLEEETTTTLGALATEAIETLSTDGDEN